MKKLFAVLVALCLLGSIAMAETATTISWTDLEPMLTESGVAGDFVTFDAVGVKIWIPEGFNPTAADQLPEGFLGYFSAEDNSAISVAYMDVNGMDLAAYAEKAKDAGATGLDFVTVNGLEGISYEIANADNSVNMCTSFVTEKGYVFEVAVGPLADENSILAATFILASMQVAE